MEMNISLQMLDTELPMPQRAHDGDAGLDLFARYPVILEPGQRRIVDTGVVVAIPIGHAGLMIPRSGLAAGRGITVINSPGLIDAGYRGELRVILLNQGDERVEIRRGDKVVQLVIIPIVTPGVEVVEELDETSRGAEGFGSSGR